MNEDTQPSLDFSLKFAKLGWVNYSLCVCLFFGGLFHFFFFSSGNGCRCEGPCPNSLIPGNAWALALWEHLAGAAGPPLWRGGPQHTLYTPLLCEALQCCRELDSESARSKLDS